MLESLKSVRSWKPHRVFLYLSIVFGLLFLIITPPFQTPDEINHFYKAYQVSQGQFISSKVDNRIGGYLPQDIAHVSESFVPLLGRMHEKTSAKQIIAKFKKVEGELEFVDFANTAVYSPISYAPQAVGMGIARLFGASPLLLMYIGRLSSLIFWIALVYMTLRNIPSFRWLLTFLALLPMSVAVNSSISADVVSNALAFLVIAHALGLAHSEMEWTRKQWIIALGLGVLLASSKLVYVPIFLLYLLVPIRKFKSKKQFFFQLGILAGLTLITVAFWSKVMAGSHLTYMEYNESYRDLSNLSFCADIHAQLSYIKGNGSYLWQTFLNAFVIPADMYLRGYIGTFGWIDTYLPTWSIVLSYGMLFFVAVTDFSLKLKPKHRIVIFSAALLMFFLVVVSQLLIWTCVGDAVVTNLQGRYFIPLFPLVFIALGGISKLRLTWLPIVVASCSSVLLVFSLTVIYDRFYVPSEFSDVSVSISAEQTKNSGKFITQHPRLFSATENFVDAVKPLNGKMRFKISKDVPFGAPLTVENCQFGDRIVVKADRLGKNGGIVLSTSDGGLYHFEKGEIPKSDSTWEKLEASLLITQPRFAGKVSVYLFQPEGDSTYFDNIEVTLRQFRR